jgi:hypothetical protein
MRLLGCWWSGASFFVLLFFFSSSLQQASSSYYSLAPALSARHPPATTTSSYAHRMHTHHQTIVMHEGDHLEIKKCDCAVEIANNNNTPAHTLAMDGGDTPLTRFPPAHQPRLTTTTHHTTTDPDRKEDD